MLVASGDWAPLEHSLVANSTKNRNIKANHVNLISMARSIDFCFKTTYLGMFLCFRSIICCFQCFVCGPSPFGKYFPMTSPTPTPQKLLPLNPPPLEISNDLPQRGYRYVLEPHKSFHHAFLLISER